jgi:site-specific DNA recombinase
MKWTVFLGLLLGIMLPTQAAELRRVDPKRTRASEEEGYRSTEAPSAMKSK